MAADLQTVHMSDGCAIKVKILGDGPNKPLVIAHHGAPGLSTYMEPAAQFGFLADIFRVLVYDMRGSGESDKNRPYTHKQWTQDVEELRYLINDQPGFGYFKQWAGDEKFLMIGASHGGFLTLEYALAHPGHLYGAIVGDSGAQFHWAAMDAVKTALTDPRVTPDPDQVVRALSGSLTSHEDLASGLGSIMPLCSVPDHLKDQAETDVSEVLAGAIAPFYETQNAAMGDCLSRFDVRDRLHEIKMPVFVYVGRYDWITPVKLSEELAAGIKDSKLVMYEKSGHMAALEEKTAFQKDVGEFLKRLDIEGLKR